MDPRWEQNEITRAPCDDTKQNFNRSSVMQSAALVKEEESGKIERKGLMYVYINMYTRVLRRRKNDEREGYM